MSRLRALLVALAATFAVLLLGAAPRAQALITNAALDEPVDQQVYPVPRVPLSGTFTVDAGSREIDVGIKRDIPDAPTAQFTILAAQLDSKGHFAVETSPDFAYNGRYLVNAVFVNNDNRAVTGCGNNPCTQQVSRTVLLAAPPAPPAGLNTAYNLKERTVTVTWADAPEPDILGWAIRRSVNGGNQDAERTVKAMKSPTLIDNALPDGGGQLEYFVTAVRQGATDKSTVRSDTVSKAVVVEAKPPDSPSTTAPKGGTPTTVSPFGPVVTAPPIAVKSRPRITGSLGDFAKGLNPGVGGSTRSTLADGTYDPTLPYAPGNQLEPGTDEAQQVFAPTPGADTGRAVIYYVAAALLTSIIGAQALYVLRQAKRLDPGLEQLPVEVLPVAEAPLPVVPRRQPRVAKRIVRPMPAEPAPKRTPRRVR